MSDNDLNVPTYIGRTACGCVVAAVVDDGTHPKRVARDVAEFIRDGLSIERVTVGWVRTCKFGCDHKPTKKKKASPQLSMNLETQGEGR